MANRAELLKRSQKKITSWRKEKLHSINGGGGRGPKYDEVHRGGKVG